MATPKRRSARPSGRGTPQRSVKSKNLHGPSLLGALIERDETPETKVQSSIDNVLSTPVLHGPMLSKIAQLSKLKTPKTEPKATHEQMNPHTVHQTTAKAPDSGLKLGFGNLPSGGRKSIAVLQNTPSKVTDSSGDAKSVAKSPYEFKFRSASHLSNEARQLMDNLRDEAARIKEQMRAEKDAQDEKDADTDSQFHGFGATGRKIAKPKGKAGRFSDVHMAAFKKMDSIANHASASRANGAPNFARPTTQSLKRSPSKAGFDELTRPRTSGKGTPMQRPPPSRLPNRRPTSISPYKNLLELPQDASTSSPTKRQRQSEHGDVSTARAYDQALDRGTKMSTLPRLISSSSVPQSLLSITKSSLARSSSIKTPTLTTDKPSFRPCSQSTKTAQPQCPSAGTPFKIANVQQVHTVQVNSNKIVPPSTSKIPRSECVNPQRPLPTLPFPKLSAKSSKQIIQRSESAKTLGCSDRNQKISPKLPTFAGLKSILRPSRTQASHVSPERAGTPKRPKTANSTGSAKKVDFTPSVKSRYAVRLAAESPSPAKMHQDTPRPPAAMFDLAAYTANEETVTEGEWEDVEVGSRVDYPILPTLPVQRRSPSIQTVDSFMQKAKEINRRESLDFISIIANGNRPSADDPFSTTPYNTSVNRTSPMINANEAVKSPGSTSKPSPSTIRRVRPSDANETVKRVEEPENYLSYGLPAKKRRHNTQKHVNPNDAKENQRPVKAEGKVPGGWEDSVLDEDEGEKRGGKRVRVDKSEEPHVSPLKKTPAREAAAKAAKDRKKGSSILSLSRLNMLARPKDH